MLQRYLCFKDQRALETEVPVKVIHTGDNPTTTKQIPEDIAELLRKTLRPKAKIVLKRIEENFNIINWNNKGALHYNGAIMHDTNIADLVATSVRKRKKKNEKLNYREFASKCSPRQVTKFSKCIISNKCKIYNHTNHQYIDSSPIHRQLTNT